MNDYYRFQLPAHRQSFDWPSLSLLSLADNIASPSLHGPATQGADSLA